MVRNLTKEERDFREHTTRRELHFNDRSGTSYGGAFYYFTYEDFEISVRAEHVQ